ncbi:MAG: hypothetical protein AB7D36_05900 [Oscillospiraceae bacterium]
MVSESAENGRMGKAFGIHKALDMAGSAIGILLAFFLLSAVGDNGYKEIFALSLMPVILALLTFSQIRERKDERTLKQREPFWKIIRQCWQKTPVGDGICYLLCRLYRVCFFDVESSSCGYLYLIWHIHRDDSGR